MKVPGKTVKERKDSSCDKQALKRVTTLRHTKNLFWNSFTDAITGGSSVLFRSFSSLLIESFTSPFMTLSSFV